MVTDLEKHATTLDMELYHKSMAEIKIQQFFLKKSDANSKIEKNDLIILREKLQLEIHNSGQIGP